MSIRAAFRELAYRVLAAGIGVIVLVQLAVAAPEGGKRVALVIGNAAYEHVSALTNPSNDAADLAGKLRGIGFDVTSGVDLDYRGMRLALRDFTQAAADADIVLIYFAGHGIEIENTNYLIPVNATLKSDRDVEFEAIRLDAVVSAVADTGGLKVILVDACRNNPFLSQMSRATATRSIGNGLAAIEPGGVVVGYAARGGTLAQDGDGRNSPYAAALLEYIDQPGLELGKMFRKVRDRVYRSTDGFQEPFTYGSLPGEDIFLVPPVQQAAMPAPLSETPAVAAPAPPQSAATPPAASPPAAATPDPETPPTALEAAAEVNTMRGWDLYAARFDRGAFRKPDVLARMRGMLPERVIKTNPQGYEITLLSDRDARRAVQVALNREGADVGSPDGVFGPKTRAGIRLIQARMGWTETGFADPALLAALDLPLRQSGNNSFINSPVAARHDPGALRLLGEEPGIVAALECLGRHKSTYGVFQGRLYVAVIRSGHVRTVRSAAKKCGLDLATVGSAAENDFIVRLFSGDPSFVRTGYDTEHNVSYKSGPYFGLTREPRDDSAATGWRWYSGEPVRYTNWLPGKPNRNGARMNKNHAKYQYESHGRTDLTTQAASEWFDHKGEYGPAFILEGNF